MPEQYPDDWYSRRKKVYKRDNYTCQNCGERGGPYGDTELHAHHIIPKSKGGSHDLDNLETLCKYCHDKVHEGGIIAPELKLGSVKLHAILLIFTFGIGNILYISYGIYKYSSNYTKIKARKNKAKYGSLLVHALLLIFTVGIGNIIYFYYHKWRK